MPFPSIRDTVRDLTPCRLADLNAFPVPHGGLPVWAVAHPDAGAWMVGTLQTGTGAFIGRVGDFAPDPRITGRGAALSAAAFYGPFRTLDDAEAFAARHRKMPAGPW